MHGQWSSAALRSTALQAFAFAPGELFFRVKPHERFQWSAGQRCGTADLSAESGRVVYGADKAMSTCNPMDESADLWLIPTRA
jgi:hypothetical protein